MKYCVKCGATLQDDALFCDKCGNEVGKSTKLQSNDNLSEKSNLSEILHKCVTSDFLFSVKGRLNRAPFNVLCIMFEAISFLIPTLAFVFLIPMISILVKRLHDLNQSGKIWVLCIMFAIWLSVFLEDTSISPVLISIAIVSVVVLEILLMIKKGTNGPNKYGDDPLMTKEENERFRNKDKDGIELSCETKVGHDKKLNFSKSDIYKWNFLYYFSPTYLKDTFNQCWKTLYSFDNKRINRKPYIIFVIFIGLCTLHIIEYDLWCSYIIESINLNRPLLYYDYCILVYLVLLSFLVQLMSVRRLYDLNYSAWWWWGIWAIHIILYLLTIGSSEMQLEMIAGTCGVVRFICEVLLMIKKGTTGPNKYGDDPLMTKEENERFRNKDKDDIKLLEDEKEKVD